jgi:hypothetical protein
VKVFYVSAVQLAEPGKRLSALVVAKDVDEAVLLLKKNQTFSGYAMPPTVVREWGEDYPAIEQIPGAQAHAGALSEKGIYPRRNRDRGLLIFGAGATGDQGREAGRVCNASALRRGLRTGAPAAQDARGRDR